MRTAATPGEVAAVRAGLKPLRTDRQDAVIEMLFTVVGDCPVCEGPVRRCDPRVPSYEGLAHRRCTGGTA